MNAFDNKTRENKSQSINIGLSQKQNGTETPHQFVDNRPEPVYQRRILEVANNSQQVTQLRGFQDMADSSPQVKQSAHLQNLADSKFTHPKDGQRKENKTGLPDSLKSGIENLSGMSLNDVRVHLNSDKPAKLKAHAYAQGTNIYLGPGQEHLLPHEGWHVVQQMQGRVQPTIQAKGISINNDSALEREADLMGDKAATQKSTEKYHALKGNSVTNNDYLPHHIRSDLMPIQCKVGFEFESNMLSWKFWKNRAHRKDDFKNFPLKDDWYGWRPLKKATKLAKGTNFTAEADEAPGGKSDVEFVTKAFEEDATGRAELSTAMDDIEEFATNARALSGPWLSMVPVSEIGVGEVALRNGALQVTKAVSGSPQATAGIMLSRVRKLLELAGTGPGSDPLVSKELMGMGGGIGADVGTRALDGANREVDTLAMANAMFDSKRLRSLVSLLASYLIYGDVMDGKDSGSITYAKNIASVMGRTDFSTMFKMLSPEVQQSFRSNPDSFVTLVLEASNLPDTKTTSVIPSGLTYEGVKKRWILDRITRDAWLTGIVKGKDILTKKKAPKGGSEMESLGALGSKTEAVGPYAQAAPIFELRRMGTSVPLTEWKPLALRVFDYLVRLNNLDEAL